MPPLASIYRNPTILNAANPLRFGYYYSKYILNGDLVYAYAMLRAAPKYEL